MEKMKNFIKGQHVSLQRLTQLVPNQHPIKKYLIKNIPLFPTPVEFGVSDVAHVTEEIGIKDILKSQQFRPPKSELSWWSLKMKNEEIRAAEKLYINRNFSNKAQELNKQKAFLKKFTTSPVFQLEKSRFGNYRFTFPLTDLIQWYKKQNCGGNEPVLKMYGTIIYKQQIVYTVLIHSPEDNKRFGEYPLLEASEWVHYQDERIIWKAQAICGTHQYQFVSGEVKRLKTPLYYAWDQVSLVFYLPKGNKPYKALKIPRERLIKALEACELDEIDLSEYQGPKTTVYRFLQAKKKVSELKKNMKK